MLFNREELVTGLNRMRLLLRYEFLKITNRSWAIFFKLVGLLVIAGIILSIPAEIGGQYIEILLPGLATVFLLHPFLHAGKVYTGGFKLPASWRSIPVPPVFWGLYGLAGKLVINSGGLVIFFLLMAAGGYSTSFLLSPYYWLLYFALIPGALGWGLLFQALSLVVETGDTGRGLRRVVEWLGGVFIRPLWLPPVLYQLSYIFPHTYLSGLGRELIKNQRPASWFYPAGAVVSFLVLGAGAASFYMVLKRALQHGKVDRDTR